MKCFDEKNHIFFCFLGIVAPEVYQQKKKRRKVLDKGTSTGPVKKVAFALDEADKTTPKTIVPKIADIVNSVVKEPKPKEDTTKVLINSPEKLEHDRSLDEKRVEKLLSAFDDDDDEAEKTDQKKVTFTFGSSVMTSSSTTSTSVAGTTTAEASTPTSTFTFGSSSVVSPDKSSSLTTSTTTTSVTTTASPKPSLNFR